MKRPAIAGVALASVAAVIGSGATAQAGPQPTHPTSPTLRADAVSLAAKAAPALASALRLGGAEKLVPKDAIVDPDGSRHLRYDRTYQGLPVVGGDMVVHQRPGGALGLVQRATNATLNLATAAKQTPAQARESALGSQRQVRYTAAGKPEKVVFAARHAPVIAYRTLLTGTRADGTPSELLVTTDADSGKVLGTREQFQTVEGTGNTEYSGKVKLQTTQSGSQYQLLDGSRGGMVVKDAQHTQGYGEVMTGPDNTWGDGKGTTNETAGADAAFGLGRTWDFYKNTFDRQGVANDGKGSPGTVHWGNNYQNAGWSTQCQCMIYGDGADNAAPLTELDVTGHELTHGVTEHTAGLDYEGDAGGLNEGTSDVMGTMVEFGAKNAVDKPDYLVGEQLDLNGDGSPLRYMDKPSKDGQSVDSWSPDTKNLDPHYSSGVTNHFFYLLSEGSGKKTIGGVDYDSPTSNGKAVEGIGRDKAAAIWYAALTKYFTSTTDYHGAREGTLRAAEDLYGADSPESDAVDATWAAVNVTADNGSGS